MRIVALVSGSGSNLQAVIDAIDAGELDNVQLVAVGADKHGTGGVDRAQQAELETFVVNFADYTERSEWNKALTDKVASYEPDYVLSSGFMRIVDEDFINTFQDRYLNTHPALLPAFPGAHGVRDALAYGVKITGCTVHVADAGVDTGPILAQAAVEVHEADTVDSLHERIKVQERALLLEVLGKLSRGVSVQDLISRR
ncbi:phosphoribosylglycinamide formyltransferase [Micrococcoides hystricis]|uniref:Phosphoribosylglycinamide formyltransferase n=1 Tax=Micrococcoides hystricis TaxID=1572761 RepID=A0ABV6P9W6_9MICC